MNTIRIAIAAAFAVVSSAAVAGNAEAAQVHGRDSVIALGTQISTASSKSALVDAVPGRQGGLSAEAKQQLRTRSDAMADLVNRNGRG